MESEANTKAQFPFFSHSICDVTEAVYGIVSMNATYGHFVFCHILGHFTVS